MGQPVLRNSHGLLLVYSQHNSSQPWSLLPYNFVSWLVALGWLPSFDVLLFRGLSCIVDASNLSLAHMTFWNPIEVQSLKSWSQRHHWLIAVEASDQPVRDEHSHEAQGDQLHPPALLCQHHVQLCQGNPQQEDSEQVIFLLLSKVYSRPTGVKSKQTSQYPGSTFTRLWEKEELRKDWSKELIVNLHSNCFAALAQAYYLFLNMLLFTCQ